jgi:hypothetical protein
MRKIFPILVLIFFCFNCISFADTITSKQIEAMETQVFGYTFKNENDIKRLDRLENYLYGSVSPSTLVNRIKKINSDLGIIAEDSKKDKISSTKTNTTQSANSIKRNIKEDPSVNYPIVDDLEQKVFSKKYNSENIYKRLDRLENKVFSHTNDDNLSNRVNKLRLSVFDSLEDNPPIAAYDENYAIADSESESYKNLKEDDTSKNSFNSYKSHNSSRQEYFNMELKSLEKIVLNNSYDGDDAQNRLNRLENKLFQRNFKNDQENERLERIAAAATAKKTSTQYDNNKLMKGLATGAQIGGILLMILAMIL